MQKMRLSIDSYKIISDNPSFMVLEIDVISDGVNHHGTEFLEEDIVKSVPHIYNKPLNAIIKNGDFTDHAWTKEDEKKQLGLGTVPETNNIRIVKKEGKSFLRINAIIWKYLYPEASEILRRRKEVSVSVEINPTKIEKLQNGVIRILEWTYEAITLLGKFIMPAVDGARAKVVKYSCDEEYFDSVFLKYGIMIDKINPPQSILKLSNECFSNEINSIDGIEILKEISSKSFNYDEILKMKDRFYSLDENTKKTIGGDKLSNWLENVISEKEGGTVVDKVKEFLTKKFSDNLSYVSHNDTQVFCFDYNSVDYKAFNYSVKEDEEVEVSDEAKVVVKLSDSDTFVETLEEGQIADMSAVLSFDKFSIVLEEVKAKALNLESEKESLLSELTELKNSNLELSTKFSDTDSKYSELEKSNSELNEKIISFSVLEKELVELREFKENSVKAEKAQAVNLLYSKYKEFLTDEEIEALNEKSKDLTIDNLQKELYSIVTPKIEASLEILKGQNTNTNNASDDNLKYSHTTFVKTEDEKIDKSLVGRLKNI